MKSSYVCIILSMLCVVLSGCGSAGTLPTAEQSKEVKQPIVFINDHLEGKEIARQKKRPTLAFFSIPDNVGSQRMMETTFQDEEIRRLATWLVCIHIDGSEERELCEALKISSFPTIILSNADGIEVCRLEGRQTPDQLAVQIHMLLQVMASRPQSVSSTSNSNVGEYQ